MGAGCRGGRGQCAEEAPRSLAGAFLALASVTGFLSDSPASSTRCMRCRTRSRMASAMVASPIQACQCSIGNWWVMMVARWPARSSMISSRSARVAGDQWLADAPVIEDQDVDLGELDEPFAEAAAAVQHTQFLGQTRHAQVQGAVAAPAGVLGERAGQPGLAHAGGAGDRIVSPRSIQCESARPIRALRVDAAAGCEGRVLDAGAGVLQLGALQQPGPLAIGAQVCTSRSTSNARRSSKVMALDVGLRASALAARRRSRAASGRAVGRWCVCSSMVGVLGNVGDITGSSPGRAGSRAPGWSSRQSPPSGTRSRLLSSMSRTWRYRKAPSDRARSQAASSRASP